MSMDINPKILVIFAAVLSYFIYEAIKMKKLWNRKRMILWICSRVTIIILLFLAVSGSQLKFRNMDNTTIFLVDESLSVNKNKKQIEEYLNYEIQKKNNSDRYAVIGFGGDTAVEIPLTNKKQQLKLSTDLQNNFTNLEKAVDYAVSLFPANNNKRLVIITDGVENKGDIRNIETKVQKEKINVLVKEVKGDKKKDVQFSQIVLPDKINENAGTVSAKLKLLSNYEGTGSIHIYMNDQKIKTMTVKVNEGENAFDFEIPLNGEREITIKGQIDFEEDENRENNICTVERKIEGESQVLVISEREEDAQNINRLLDNLKIKRANYSSNSVPVDSNFLSDFTEVILVNTEYKNLPKGFDDNLEKAVKNFGTGLLIVGGENSFALGGYKGTKLESMLPVSSTMQNKKKQGNTGLVLMIDCSGSMNDESQGIKKIELAKQGAIEAIKALENEDYVGVLAFSDTLEWVVPYQKAENKEKLISEVGKLKSKGGTLIIPGLVETYDKIKDSDVKVKHIILITDGQAEKSGFDKYVDEMKNKNITLSTIAVGEDCDKEVLSKLSKALNGRQYYSNDYRSVPQIMLKETCISEKKYLNNEAFKPKEYKSEIYPHGNDIPELYGYTGTGIKSNAVTVLESNLGDPVLAYWSYGIGKTAVWTSDLSGNWSCDWIEWDGFNKYWSSLLNYIDKSKGNDKLSIELNRTGANVEITASTHNLLSEDDVECMAFAPDGSQKNVKMTLKENGKYEGSFELDAQGKYKFTAYLKEDGKVSGYAEKSIYLDYSPEYDIDMKKYKELNDMVLKCRGNYLSSDENVFKEPIVNKNISYVNLDFILLPLAFLIFLFDIWLRIHY